MFLGRKAFSMTLAVTLGVEDFSVFFDAYFSLTFRCHAFGLFTKTLHNSRITDGILFTLLTSEVGNSKDILDDVQPKNSSGISVMDKILGLSRSLFG